MVGVMVGGTELGSEHGVMMAKVEYVIAIVEIEMIVKLLMEMKVVEWMVKAMIEFL